MPSSKSHLSVVSSISFTKLTSSPGQRTALERRLCLKFLIENLTVSKYCASIFSFTSSSGASDHGDLSVARGYGGGQSSSDYGYHSGGNTSSDTIDRFAFSSNTTATDWGNLTVSRGWMAGQSSTTHGFTSGGNSASLDEIDRFAFSSNAGATDWGNLSVARNAGAGSQY